MKTMQTVVGIILTVVLTVTLILLMLAACSWAIRTIEGTPAQQSTYVCQTHTTDEGAKQLICKTE